MTKLIYGNAHHFINDNNFNRTKNTFDDNTLFTVQQLRAWKVVVLVQLSATVSFLLFNLFFFVVSLNSHAVAYRWNSFWLPWLWLVSNFILRLIDYIFINFGNYALRSADWTKIKRQTEQFLSHLFETMPNKWINFVDMTLFKQQPLCRRCRRRRSIPTAYWFVGIQSELSRSK